jgi:hypothetical protein
MPLSRPSAKPKHPAPPQAPQLEPGRRLWIFPKRGSVCTANLFEAIARPMPNNKPNVPKVKMGISISILNEHITYGAVILICSDIIYLCEFNPAL